MDQGAGFVTYHNQQEQRRQAENARLLDEVGVDIDVSEFVVSLGASSALIEAYNAEEARQMFIEMYGIDQTEHDYISVEERVA